MLITKTFHFHAAHRNIDLGGKCASLHGHTYYCALIFDMSGVSRNERTGVTVSFEDLEEYCTRIHRLADHVTIVDRSDETLVDFLEKAGSKSWILDGPTSVENLAQSIYELVKSAFPKHSDVQLDHVELRETPSSTVSYPNSTNKKRKLS